MRPGEVGLYLRPTVYNFAHIATCAPKSRGRAHARVRYDGYNVEHVMNVTDVGHLTSDADEGGTR